MASSILTNLIAYYKMDEQGTAQRLDFHSTNHLNASGNCSATTGRVRLINSATFGSGLSVGPATSGFLHIDDNAAFSTGDIDFSIAGWFQIQQKDRSSYALVSKWKATGNQREYCLDYLRSSDRFRFRVSSNGTAVVTALANGLGSPSINTWYFIVAAHDSVANTISIEVNRGTATSTATSAGVFNSTAPFRVAAEDDGVQLRLKGLADGVGFWKKILTTAEKDELYSGAYGKEYPWGYREDKRSIKPGGGGDYVSLHAWQTAEVRDLVKSNIIAVAEVYSGGNAGTNASTLTVTGWTTDRTHNVFIRGVRGQGHEGTGRPYTTSRAYIDYTGNDYTVRVQTRDFQTENMQYLKTGGTGNFSALFFDTVGGPAVGNSAQLIADKCVFVIDTTGTNGALRIQGGGTTVEVSQAQNNIIKNSLILSRGSSTSTGAVVCVSSASTGGTRLHHCTVINANNGHAIQTDAATGHILQTENCYLRRGGTASCYAGLAANFRKGGADSTNNAEALHKRHRNIPYSTISFAGVTASSENLHINFGASGLFRAGNNTTQQAFKSSATEFVVLDDWEYEPRSGASGKYTPPGASGGRYDVGMDQIPYEPVAYFGGHLDSQGHGPISGYFGGHTESFPHTGPTGYFGGHLFCAAHTGPTGYFGGHLFCVSHTGPTGLFGGHLQGSFHFGPTGYFGGHTTGFTTSSGVTFTDFSGYFGGHILCKTVFGNQNFGLFGGFLRCDSNENAGKFGGYINAMTLGDPSGFFGGHILSYRMPPDAKFGGYLVGFPSCKEFVETHSRTLVKARSSQVVGQDLNIDCVVIFKGVSNNDFNAKFQWIATNNTDFNAKFKVENYKRPPEVQILNVSDITLPGGCKRVTVTASGTLKEGKEWISAYIDFGQPLKSANPRVYTHNMSISGFNTPPPWTAYHDYCTSGYYIITARGQDNLGMVGMDGYRLDLRNGVPNYMFPGISISGTPRSGFVPDPLKVDFVSLSSGIAVPPATLAQRNQSILANFSDTRIVWNFGNREISSRRRPFSFYASPGRYVIALRYLYSHPSGQKLYVSDSLLLGYSK